MSSFVALFALLGPATTYGPSVSACTNAQDPPARPPTAEVAPSRPILDATLRARILQHAGSDLRFEDPTNRWFEDARAAQLGQKLFFEARLSPNGAVSCATCHDPARAFSDGKALAVGIGTAERNTPALWNVGAQRWFFLDGRADSLWSQALGPIENDVEMGGDRASVARLLVADGELRADYEAVFGSLDEVLARELAALPQAKPMPQAPDDARARTWDAGTTAQVRTAVDRIFANAGKSLAAYQRRLTSSNSAFDRFAEAVRVIHTSETRKMHDEQRVQREALRGDKPVASTNDTDRHAAALRTVAAFPDDALRGLELFVGRANCRLCHVGPLFSDGEFHSIGLPEEFGKPPRDSGRLRGVPAWESDPFNAAGKHSDAPDGERARDLGAIKAGPETWGQFKTPSLRNVALTAPYMHVGQMPTLEKVIEFYSTLEGAAALGHHGETVLKPLRLTLREIADLAAFLRTLTDDSLPADLRQRPPRPESR